MAEIVVGSSGGSSVVVDSLFIVAPIVCSEGHVLGPYCFCST